MMEVTRAHILVVDDDPQIRSLLDEYLTENGMRVSTAASGRDLGRGDDRPGNSRSAAQ
jgi:DNA-binding response OmpR family regulator